MLKFKFLAKKETTDSKEQQESIKEAFITSKKIKYVLTFFLVLTLVIGGAIGIYHYKFKKSGVETTSGEASQLISKVRKLIILPKNESPTIATVSDKTKLAGQTFFAKAENGDRVLIYSNAQQAILYRPATNQIVNVASLNINEQVNSPNPNTGAQEVIGFSTSASPPVSPTPIVKPKTVILNGTKKSGLAKSAQSSLLEKSVVNLDVDLGNSQNNYEETLVVDLSGKNSQIVEQIIGGIGGKKSSLPDGEIKPDNADILIIIGSDFTSK